MQEETFYSVRMRASMNGSHEDGGKHISGGERLIPFHEMKHTVNALLEKGLSHSRGKPDFMQIQFEEVHESIKTIQPLPVHTNEVSCPEEGQKLAFDYDGERLLPGHKTIYDRVFKRLFAVYLRWFHHSDRRSFCH